MAPVNTQLSKEGGEKLNDLKLSRDEVDKFCKALKDEKFRKLLGEYAEEIQNPENRKRYEQEIAELELERGYDVTWIHPQPGYVLKLSDGAAQKVFVNVCSSHQVDKPSCQRSRHPGQPGLNWSIPYALSKPRDDRDKTGATCRVYDVVFHPDTVYMAERNPRMQQLVRDTALQAVDDAFQAGLDRSKVVTPKLKYKGVPQACVVRRRRGDVATDAPPLQQHVEDKLRQDTDALSLTADAASAAAGDGGATYEIPEYRLVYRDRSAMDHLAAGGGSSGGRPEALVVRISLPRLSSAAGLDLDVGTTSLRLVSQEPARYRLLLSLPLAVDDGAGGAAFDKASRSLVVTLPVLQTPDSGIDSDGVRNESDEDAGGDASSGPDSLPCEVVRRKGDDTEPLPEPEPERLYSLPSYSLQQDSRCLYLTIHQASIVADSVRLERRQQQLLVTLSSVGAGLARLHFRVCVSLPAPLVSEPRLWQDQHGVRLRADKDVGLWTTCLLGADPDHMQQVSIPWKEEESVSAAASAAEESVSAAEESVSTAAVSAAEESVSAAAVSAAEESVSSAVVSAAEETSPMSESDAEEAMPASAAEETPAPAAEEAPVSAGGRPVRPSLSSCSVTSCDGPLSASSLSSFDESPSFQKKSILKKRYASESSADEVAASGSLLPSSLLFSCDETEETATAKKAVRFSEHIREKRYRSTATIVHDAQRAEKQRAKKKRARAARRRHSEGDASSETEESTAPSTAEQPPRCSSETDTSENDEAAPAADPGGPSKHTAKKRKNKRKQERRQKDVLNNELMFDLDM